MDPVLNMYVCIPVGLLRYCHHLPYSRQMCICPCKVCDPVVMGLFSSLVNGNGLKIDGVGFYSVQELSTP